MQVCGVFRRQVFFLSFPGGVFFRLPAFFCFRLHVDFFFVCIFFSVCWLLFRIHVGFFLR